MMMKFEIHDYDRQIASVIDIILRLRKENGIAEILDTADFDDDDLLDTSANNESSKVYIDVRRKYVLKDAFRECKKNKFDPKKLLRIILCFTINLTES